MSAIKNYSSQTCRIRPWNSLLRCQSEVERLCPTFSQRQTAKVYSNHARAHTILDITSYSSLIILNSMLQYDPKLRPSAAKTLKSSYLLPYHVPANEPIAPEEFDWSFVEADYSTDLWKSLRYSEILDFYQGNVGGWKLWI
ncbi:hypothetical protein N7540_002068 [Penicillium herquei]|nr:hypothetical protein N7540_002068 [Penicillium herquei]